MARVSLPAVKAEVSQVHEEVRKISVILTGNGHPDNGLVVKVDRLVEAERHRAEDEAKKVDHSRGLVAGVIVAAVGGCLSCIAAVLPLVL